MIEWQLEVDVAAVDDDGDDQVGDSLLNDRDDPRSRS